MNKKHQLFFLLLFLTFSGKSQDLTGIKLLSENLIGTSDSVRFFKTLSNHVREFKFVGVGESTHGTQEYRRFFSKLAKHLIQSDSFNVIYFAEVEFVDSFSISDYVLGRTERLSRPNPHFTSTQVMLTKEFLDLIEWIREFNKSRSEKNKIHVAGGDISDLNRLAQIVLELTRSLRIDLPKRCSRTLMDLAYMDPGYLRAYFRVHKFKEVLDNLSSLSELELQDDERGNSPCRRYIQALRGLKSSLLTWEGRLTHNKTTAYRDDAMLDNLEWVLAPLKNPRVLFFAHNAHVQKKRIMAGTPRSFGQNLASRHKDQVFTIATEAGLGKVYPGLELPSDPERLGLQLTHALAEEGAIYFQDNSEVLRHFKGKLKLSLANLNVSTSYPVTNLSSGFDCLFYSPNSTPQIPSDILPYRNFTFSLDPLQGDHFNDTLKIKINLNTEPSPQNCVDNQHLYLTVLFFDSKDVFLDLIVQDLLNHNEILFESRKPPSTAKLFITIKGEKVEKFTLKKVILDERAIPFREITISENGYSTSENEQKEIILYGKQ